MCKCKDRNADCAVKPELTTTPQIETTILRPTLELFSNKSVFLNLLGSVDTRQILVLLKYKSKIPFQNQVLIRVAMNNDQP
jgi:hypothetical protein